MENTDELVLCSKAATYGKKMVLGLSANMQKNHDSCDRKEIEYILNGCQNLSTSPWCMFFKHAEFKNYVAMKAWSESSRNWLKPADVWQGGLLL